MRFRLLPLTAMVAGLTLTASLPAWAADAPPDSPNEVASLIQQVAPAMSPVKPTSARDDGITYTAATTTITLPAQDSGTLTASLSGQTSLGIRLPSELDAQAAQVATNGTAVYVGEDASLGVQANAAGVVRLQTITNTAAGPERFTYTLTGAVRPALQADGSVLLLKDVDDATFSMGQVEAPWARDAAGAAVPTHYEISGNSLVQVIEPSAATVYPVVADPQITFGVKFAYVNAYGYQWVALSKALVGTTVLAAFGACANFSKLPSPWAAVLTKACQTLGLTNVQNVLKWVQQTGARGVDDIWACYQVAVVQSDGLHKVQAEGNCVRKG